MRPKLQPQNDLDKIPVAPRDICQGEQVLSSYFDNLDSLFFHFQSQATTDVVGNVVQSIFGGGGKPSYKPPGQGKPSYKAPAQNKPSYKPQGGGGGRKPSYKPQSGGGGGKPSYKPPGRGKPSNGGVGGGVIQSLRNLKSQKTSFIQVGL